MFETKARTKDKSPLKVLLFGTALNAAAFFICTLIASAVVYTLENPSAAVGVGSMLSLYVCAAICGFIISRYKGEGGTLHATVAALVFVLLLLTAGLVMTKGSLPFVTVVNYAAYILISAIFSLVGRKRQRRRRRR